MSTTPAPPAGQHEPGEFYVGYLPTPARQRRFLLVVLGSLLLATAAVAVAVAALQRDPGDAIWRLDDATHYDGIIRLDPYPVLLMPGRSGAPWHAVLLVGEGKVGVRARVAPWAGRPVRVRGTVLVRGPVNMLELLSADDALAALNAPEAAGWPAPPDLTPAGASVALRGEIIDPKCYLGAMKPGEGKTHKACAALCLRGGIPPMFVAELNGRRTCLLLVDERGEGFQDEGLERLIADVGEPVTLTARRSELADLPVLRLHPPAIRRE